MRPPMSQPAAKLGAAGAAPVEHAMFAGPQSLPLRLQPLPV